jgi:hypothetical protein
MAGRRKRRSLPEEDLATTFANITSNPITRVDLGFLKADDNGRARGYAAVNASPDSATGIVPAAHSGTAETGIVPVLDSGTVDTGIVPVSDSGTGEAGIVPGAHSGTAEIGIGSDSGISDTGIVLATDSGIADTGIVPASNSGTVRHRDPTVLSDLISTDSSESELVPMGVAGDSRLSMVGMWITETGKMVPKGRVSKVGYVQDVLSAYEQLLYNVLWQAKPKADLRGFKYPILVSAGEEYKLVRASYDDLMNVSKLGKNTVIRIIETLTQKDCIEIEQLADIFTHRSTLYRVYSFKAVRPRRLRNNHIYAAKLGKTFSFVRPVQAIISTDLDSGTIPTIDTDTIPSTGTTDTKTSS